MSKGWIGCDLDGTLARLDEWRGFAHIGEPVPKMVERVKFWLAQGIEVRLMTARVASTVPEKDVDEFLRAATHWMFKHLGTTLPITAEKDYNMLCLYDDRCVAIEKNTGRALSPDWFGERMFDK